jgi:hypothetical protein
MERGTGRQCVERKRAAAGQTRAALAWLVAALLVAGCGQQVSDPETRIREALAEAEIAAESGDLDALAARVARDYADREGRDRRTLLLTLRGLLMRYPRLELVVTIKEIEIVSPQFARVRVEVLAAGAGPAGLSADAFPLEVSLRDDGDGWQVTWAEWGRRFAGGI